MAQDHPVVAISLSSTPPVFPKIRPFHTSSHYASGSVSQAHLRRCLRLWRIGRSARRLTTSLIESATPSTALTQFKTLFSALFTDQAGESPLNRRASFGCAAFSFSYSAG